MLMIKADAFRMSVMNYPKMMQKLLYFHAIWNLRNYNSLTELLVNKSGKRPFDIIMTIHLLHDKEIVKLDQNNHWNIKKTDE